MDGLEPLRRNHETQKTEIQRDKSTSEVKDVALSCLTQQASPSSVLKNKITPLEKQEIVKIEGFSIAVDKKTLDDLAIEEGYGYKTANLMLLERECAKINGKLSQAEVRVPPFIGITDASIQDYLNTAIPDLIPLWSAFLASFDQNQKEQFLLNPNHSSITISPQGIDILRQIQDKISAHFQNNHFENDKLAAWLKNNPTTYLMVRSTGKEDTDESSNAGGNESVASVSPDSHSLSVALGRVIGSYFGAKSITQRLTLGDVSVFTEPKPFVPVLFQVMVGEEPNNIPRSGVMFTSEHHLAPNVTRIQTGLGHNEGIVNSKVEVDSYLIDKEQNVHSVIRHKKTRIKQGIEVPNDFKAQTAPALAQETIVSMKTVSDHLQDLYQKPLDIEYTIKKEGSKDIVYLLQTRPLKKPEKEPQPSYIDFDHLKTGFITSNVLPDSNSQVIRVDNVEEIIFASNILVALDKFNDPKTDRSKIKAVIINGSTSPSSHPAVFLRAKGLPIFMVESASDFTALTKAKEWTLDVQQGIIIPRKCSPDLVANGYICYPIPRELTLDIPPIAKAQLIAAKETDPSKKARLEQYVKKELAKFNAEIPQMIDELRNGQQLPSVKTIRELLRQLAMQDSAEAKLALATLIDYFSKKVANSIRTSEGRQDAQLPQWIALENLIHLAKKEIIPALEKHPPQSLERLYPLKFLEAIVLQPASNSVVGGYSFGLAALTNKKETASLNEASKVKPGIQLTPNQYIALNFKAEIYKKETQDKWVHYVANLSEVEVNQLVENLLKLQKLGSSAEWLNIRFPEAQSPIVELKSEIELNHNILANLDKIAEFMNRHEKTLNDWSDPQYALKNTKEFIDTARLLFDQMEKDYKEAGWIGKIALANVEAQLVDIYDQTIKAVTGSTKFSSDEQKLTAFKELLKGYRTVLEKIAGDGMAPGSNSFSAVQGFKNLNEFLVYLDAERIKNLPNFSKPLNPFQVRSSFEVAPLTISYRGLTNLALPTPMTEEEFFTVYHQNLINAINLRKYELGLDKGILPTEIQRTVDVISRGRYPADISYIGKENGKLNILFNIPLGSHSATYKLIFDPKAPNSGFELHFSINGLNVGQRFQQIGSIGSLIIGSGNLKSGELPVKYGSAGVSFSIKVPHDEPLEGFFKKLDRLLEMTFATPSFPTIKNEFGFDYKTIREEAFSDSLHWNHAIITDVSSTKDWPLVVTIAKQTLAGLASRKLPDYSFTTAVYGDDDEDSYPELEGILGNFNVIPGNRDGRKVIMSMVLEASLYLVRCLKEGGQVAQEARNAIEELSQSPEVQAVKGLAHCIAALKKADQIISLENKESGQ
jgi:hypothetical protein